MLKAGDDEIPKIKSKAAESVGSMIENKIKSTDDLEKLLDLTTKYQLSKRHALKV